MNIESLNRLVDAYQDGEIEKDDAHILAKIIRDGGNQSDWILNELKMRGLISVAIGADITPDSFLRIFLERFSAEKGKEDFKKSFEKRQAERSQFKPGKPKILNALVPGRVVENSDIEKENQKDGAKNKKLIVTVLIAIVLTALVTTWLLQPNEVAMLKHTTSGTTIQRGAELLEASDAMPLFSGDRIKVAPNGMSTITWNESTSMQLDSGTDLILNIQNTKEKSEQHEYSHRAYLEEGKVSLLMSSNHMKHAPLLSTQSAKIIVNQGQAEVHHARGQTLIQCMQGKLSLWSTAKNEHVELESGQYAIIDSQGRLESHLNKKKKE